MLKVACGHRNAAGDCGGAQQGAGNADHARWASHTAKRGQGLRAAGHWRSKPQETGARSLHNPSVGPLCAVSVHAAALASPAQPSACTSPRCSQVAHPSLLDARPCA